jgi:hypothetical protein
MNLTSAYGSTGREDRAPDDAASAVDGALDVLSRHTVDDFGMCAGCQAMWSRLIPYPCTQVSWARAVIGAAYRAGPATAA